MAKKVTVERFVAALVDGLILQFVAFIPVVIYFVGWGFDGLMEYFLSASTPGAELELAGIGNFIYISAVIGFILSVLYFVYMPYKMNGQTLGKKLMKIKAIDEIGDNPSFKQHTVRAIQNWAVYVSTPLMILLLVSESTYLLVNMLASLIVSLLTFVSYIMLMARSDGKGLHDLWSGTQVVSVDIDLNKDFVVKTTQMGDWADVEHGDSEQEEEDPWK